MRFVVFHGSFSTASDAWFPWLKKQLENLGHIVFLPQFTVDKWNEVKSLNVSTYHSKQSLEIWLKDFENIRKEIVDKSDISFIGHSLGPLFILHIVQRYAIQLKSAYFIAPFLEVYGKSDVVEKANKTFYKTDFDFIKLRTHIPESTVIYSDDDPYIEEEKSLAFAYKMNSRAVKLHGFRHMGLESGMKEFPELLNIIKKDIGQSL